MKKIIALPPFLLGLFPVFYIYSQRKETIFETILVPTGIVFLMILALWLLLIPLIKDREKRTLCLSLFVLFFFSFGYAYTTFKEYLPRAVEEGYFFFFFIWLILLVSALFVILKMNKGKTSLAHFFTFMAGGLILFLLLDIFPIRCWFGSPGFQPVKKNKDLLQIQEKSLIPGMRWPNIYYLIIDGYGRSDILKDFYNLNNQEFIDFLKQKGFFVADKSRANYPQTALSLASSLNFHYIDQLLKGINPASDNREPLANLIRDNLLFYHLKRFNYSIITFASGKSETEIKKGVEQLAPRWSFSEFHNLLINSTPLPLILKGWQYQSHRERVLFIFKELEKVPQGTDPFLAFAHIIAPHPPFVFGESGEPVQPNRNFSLGDGDHFTRNSNREEYRQSYTKEVLFLNKKLKEVIQKILAQSSVPPIIILQADHGPGSYLEWRHPENTNLRERMSNFTACFLPGQGEQKLSPTITPVNIFRIILNQYFGGGYPLLKDEIYFASLSRPYQWIKVTEKTE